MESIKEKLQHQKTIKGKRAKELLFAFARTGMSLCMALSDVLSLLLAGFISIHTREFLLGGLPEYYAAWMPLLVVVFMIVYASRGLYPGIGLGVVQEFRLLTIMTSLVFLSLGSVTYLSGVEGGFSRLTFGFTWLLSIGIVPFNRIVIRHLLNRLDVWGEPVVVIGRKEEAEQVAHYFSSDPKAGLRPVMIASGRADVEKQLSLKTFRPRTAVVVYKSLSELPQVKACYRDVFERVILFSSRGYGLDLSGLNVRLFGNQLAFEIRHSLMDPWAQFVKRVIDLVGAGLGLFFLSPFLALISLLIKLESRGPVFYLQQRVGKRDRVFGMIKFRTMHVNADEMLHKYLERNPEAQKEWDCYQKLHNDPRITKVGRILRRFSIDELPQLWNVLLGEMSLVGPRPIMVNQREMYGENFAHYQRVVPGITGLWQISGRNHTSFAVRTDFDVRYVMSWSIWLDIYILIRTVWVVFKHDGAC